MGTERKKVELAQAIMSRLTIQWVGWRNVLSNIGFLKKVGATRDDEDGLRPQVEFAFFEQVDFRAKLIEAIQNNHQR